MCPIFRNMPVLPSEFLLGYTADGLFEIIMRPSKFFFRKKIFFFKFYFFMNFLIELIVCKFFFSVKVTYCLFFIF